MTFTKEQLEGLIKRIIHQDSYGDVHYEACKVAAEHGLDLSKDKDEYKNNYPFNFEEEQVW